MKRVIFATLIAFLLLAFVDVKYKEAPEDFTPCRDGFCFPMREFNYVWRDNACWQGTNHVSNSWCGK